MQRSSGHGSLVFVVFLSSLVLPLPLAAAPPTSCRALQDGPDSQRVLAACEDALERLLTQTPASIPDLADTMQRLRQLYLDGGAAKLSAARYQRLLELKQAVDAKLLASKPAENKATAPPGPVPAPAPELLRAIDAPPDKLRTLADLLRAVVYATRLWQEPDEKLWKEVDFEEERPVSFPAIALPHPAYNALEVLATRYERQGKLGQAVQTRQLMVDLGQKDAAMQGADIEHYSRSSIPPQVSPQFLKAAGLIEVVGGGAGETDSAVRSAHAIARLAHVQELLGRFETAELQYQRALRLYQLALGPSHAVAAAAMSDLGLFYVRRGLFDRAESWLSRAVTVLEAAPEPIYRPLVNYVLPGMSVHCCSAVQLGTLQVRQALSATLDGQGMILRSRGDYDRAIERHLQARALREGMLAQDSAERDLELSALALAYREKGQLTEALPLLELRHRAAERSLGAEDPRRAQALSDLGVLYLEAGQLAKAAPLLRQALAIYTASLGPRHSTLGPLLRQIGRLALLQGQDSEAWPVLERAFAIEEETLRQLSAESRIAAALRSSRAEDYYAPLLSHLTTPAALRLALTVALLRKGRTAEEGARSLRLITQAFSRPAQKEEFARLRALRSQHESLLLSGPAARPDYQQTLAVIQAEAEELEHRLVVQNRSVAATTLPEPNAILSKVAQALPKDGALVEVVAVQAAPAAPPHYLALLLFPDERMATVDLGEAPAIEALCSELLARLRTAGEDPLPAAQAAYQQLMAPLLPALRGIRRLYLSLEGSLHFIPFMALHDGKDYLLGSYQLTYLSSGRDLLSPAAEPPGSDAMIIADPEFGSLPAAAGSVVPAGGLYARLGAITPLPGTRREAVALQSILPGATVLLGAAATEAAFRKIESPRLLHIATHGVFVDGDLASASAATGTGGRSVAVGVLPTETVVRPRPIDNPLSRAALLLAGAAQAALSPDSTQDGLITAREVSSMNLGGTQLVVLSACETGSGSVETGQGVYGMRRAFLIAGAETLVTSLWRVADQETSQLMERYYQNLKAGQGRAAAMQQAAQWMRHKQPHPYYWAPFIVAGRDTPLRAAGSARPAPEAKP